MDCALQALLAQVDPELRAAALQMREFSAQFMPMKLDKLATRRRFVASMTMPLLAAIPAQEMHIPGPTGAPEVPLWLINCVPSGAPQPAIVHMHGGGLTASSARGSVPQLQSLAKAIDCAIVSVDFRNAPETRYDGSLEDNYAALKWLHRNAAALNVDSDRIAVMGESGGGTHAALLAIAARDRGEYPVMYQALIYPMLDDRTGSSRAAAPHLGAFNWNADANRFGWTCFLGQEAGSETVPSNAVPARVDTVAGLPPTFIAVGSLDLFVEEDIAYARRLIDAQVPTELLVMPGCFHGFDMIAKGTHIAERFAAAKVDALRRPFAR